MTTRRPVSKASIASGVYQGPSTVAELEAGKSVTAPEDGTITMTASGMVLGTGCTVALTAKQPVAFRADTSGASNIKVLALVDGPTDGQMCTLQTAAGAVTFIVVDGLITVWRADDDATIEIALSGTTAGGGTVSYNFTGYR